MAKAADISKFQVSKRALASTVEATGRRARRGKGESVKKLFSVRPEAAVQFDVLKAEQQQSGTTLIAEALNLLFQKYGKPPVA